MPWHKTRFDCGSRREYFCHWKGLSSLYKLVNWYCTLCIRLWKVLLVKPVPVIYWCSDRMEIQTLQNCGPEWAFLVSASYSHLISQTTTKFIYCLKASNINHTRSWKELFPFYKGICWVIKSVFFKCGPKTKRLTDTFQHSILKIKYVYLSLFSSLLEHETIYAIIYK